MRAYCTRIESQKMQSDRALKLHCPTIMWSRILIGVSGYGGTGKSTLCALLSATCNHLWGSTGNTSSDVLILFMIPSNDFTALIFVLSALAQTQTFNFSPSQLSSILLFIKLTTQ